MTTAIQESHESDQDVIERLRQALVDADGYLAVETAFRRLVPEGEEDRHRAFVFAFGYMLVHDPERREDEGPFAPAIVTNRGQFPPGLSDIEPADVEAWRSAVEQLDDPIALSRLHDLLWERRDGARPDLDARAAVDAYVAVSRDRDWHAVERVDCVTRALELVRAVNDPERHDTVVAAAVDLIREDLAAEDGGPGVSLTLLATLAKLDPPPEPFDELLDLADRRYGDDPYMADTVTDLRIMRSPEERAEFRRQQVQKWRQAATERGGIVKTIYLRRGLEIATTHGLADLVDSLRLDLQEIQPEEFDLKTISAEVKIPTERIRSLIDAIVGEDWEQSLARFGQVSPPGGEPHELDQQIEELKKAAPLQFLMSKVLIGPDETTTIFEARDDESHLRLARAEQRSHRARFWSLIAVDVLSAIHERHGMPSRDQLTEFFATDFIGPEKAERVARAVELYLEGQPDEAAHVLVPRIEAVIRELARRIGIPIVREPAGATPGRVQSLGRILDQLTPHFPQAGWHAYLENLLTDELGLNLRNVISHGLSDLIDAPDAALLIQAACYLKLLHVSNRHQEEADR